MVRYFAGETGAFMDFIAAIRSCHFISDEGIISIALSLINSLRLGYS